MILMTAFSLNLHSFHTLFNFLYVVSGKKQSVLEETVINVDGKLKSFFALLLVPAARLPGSDPVYQIN